jgi:biotin carboxyl carrier protein
MTDVLTFLPRPGSPAPRPHRPAPPSTAPRPHEPITDVDVPASTLADSVAHQLVIVVAPSIGRFRPAEQDGSAVTVAQVLGHVTGGKGRADAVTAPVDGQLSRMLVRPGQQVARGQGIAWVQRAGDTAGGVPR